MKRWIVSIFLSAVLICVIFMALLHNNASAASNGEIPSPTPEVVVIMVAQTPTPMIELTPSPTSDPSEVCIRAYELNETDVEWLARLTFLSPLADPMYKASLIWLVLNRVDSSDFPNTVQLVISQGSRNGSGGEFGFWDEDKIIKPENLAANKELARLVLNQWLSEKAGHNAGRPIPKEALFIRFTGEKNRNLELLSERGGNALYYPIRGAYEY